MLGRSCSIDLLSDTKHLSEVEKSAFTDILGEGARSRTYLQGHVHTCLVQARSRLSGLVSNSLFIVSLWRILFRMQKWWCTWLCPTLLT